MSEGSVSIKGVYRACATFDSEIRLCSLCDCILEYRYNAKGILCLACVNHCCPKFKRFMAVSKPEFLKLISLGFVMRRRLYV